jgi:hypothetical protein
LQRRALILNTTPIQRLANWCEQHFSLTVFLGSLLVYGLRGNQFNRLVFGDDATLVSHALDRQQPWGVLGKFDRLGLFDPFNDYLAVLLRVFTHLGLLGPDELFTTTVFFLMTLFWATTTFAISHIVMRRSGISSGFFVAIFLAFLPFSNQVLLAQTNTVAWPLALLCVVIVALKAYPQRTTHRIGVLVLFSLTTMSTGTMVVVIPLLVLSLVYRIKSIRGFEGCLLVVTVLSFLLQWYTFAPRPNVSQPLSGELYRMAFSWAPQFVRSQVNTSLSFLETVTLWTVPVVLLIAWLILFMNALAVDKPYSFAALKMLVVSLGLAPMLIIGNGWFNTHYMYIPMALFWVSISLMLKPGVLNQVARVRSAVVALVVCYATTVSGVFFVL